MVERNRGQPVAQIYGNSAEYNGYMLKLGAPHHVNETLLEMPLNLLELLRIFAQPQRFLPRLVPKELGYILEFFSLELRSWEQLRSQPLHGA